MQWWHSWQFFFFFFFLQIIVIVITGTLFGVNLYGTLMLRQYFDRVWFLPPESMGYKYTLESSKVWERYYSISDTSYLEKNSEFPQHESNLYGLYDLPHNGWTLYHWATGDSWEHLCLTFGQFLIDIIDCSQPLYFLDANSEREALSSSLLAATMIWENREAVKRLLIAEGSESNVSSGS